MENSYTKYKELMENQLPVNKQFIENNKSLKDEVYTWVKSKYDKDQVLMKQGIKIFFCCDKEFDKLERDIKYFIDNYYMVLFDGKTLPNLDSFDLSIKEKNTVFQKTLFNYKASFQNTATYNPDELIEEHFTTVLISYNITCSVHDKQIYFEPMNIKSNE